MDVSFVDIEAATGPFLADEAVAVGVWQGGRLAEPTVVLDKRGGCVSHLLHTLRTTEKTDFSPASIALQQVPAQIGAGWLLLVGLGHGSVHT